MCVLKVRRVKTVFAAVMPKVCAFADSAQVLPVEQILQAFAEPAQNLQKRLYAQAGGKERTAIMGTLALWKWDPEQATHPALARPLFAQVCKN